MRGLKPAEWGASIADVTNAADNPLFHEVELYWEKPTPWEKGQRLPTFNTDRPFLYILMRDHPRSLTKDRIEYIGLTTSPRTRFGNHSKAKEIVRKSGKVLFSYAEIEFITGRDKLRRQTQALNELEHLLIWAVPPTYLENIKKWHTLPGMGQNGGEAWHVKNKGYRFRGQMPREIIYPWMLVRPGRDRFTRQTHEREDGSRDA